MFLFLRVGKKQTKVKGFGRKDKLDKLTALIAILSYFLDLGMSESDIEICLDAAKSYNKKYFYTAKNNIG